MQPPETTRPAAFNELANEEAVGGSERDVVRDLAPDNQRQVVRCRSFDLEATISTL